ncbi:hypothetical protein AB0903_27455 [Streptomyces sp. NPDC048389]|uniref:hypothetical protein n=1 Tax=Streptomyces sp. NPDC048389 TaxID=3154622 RepID=UPI0034561A11
MKEAGSTSLGDRLDAIEQALQVARQESRPERREQLLNVVGRAAQAARTEHQAAEEAQRKRPAFRVIQGGAVAATLAGVGAGMRSYWLQHRPTTVALAGAAVSVSALLYFALDGGPRKHPSGEELVPSPAVTVAHTEQAERDRTPEPWPATSPTPPVGEPTAPVVPVDEAEPTGREIPAAESSKPAGSDSPTAEPPRPGRGTGPAVPPGLDRDGEGMRPHSGAHASLRG